MGGNKNSRCVGGLSGSLARAYLILRDSRLAEAPGFNQEEDKLSTKFLFIAAVYLPLQSCTDVFILFYDS